MCGGAIISSTWYSWTHSITAELGSSCRDSGVACLYREPFSCPHSQELIFCYLHADTGTHQQCRDLVFLIPVVPVTFTPLFLQDQTLQWRLTSITEFMTIHPLLISIRRTGLLQETPSYRSGCSLVTLRSVRIYSTP